MNVIVFPATYILGVFITFVVLYFRFMYKFKNHDKTIGIFFEDYEGGKAPPPIMWCVGWPIYWCVFYVIYYVFFVMLVMCFYPFRKLAEKLFV